MVYKRIVLDDITQKNDFRLERYTKNGFGTGVVYKRLAFRRERYTKGYILDGCGIQKNGV